MLLTVQVVVEGVFYVYQVVIPISGGYLKCGMELFLDPDLTSRLVQPKGALYFPQKYSYCGAIKTKGWQ